MKLSKILLSSTALGLFLHPENGLCYKTEEYQDAKLGHQFSLKVSESLRDDYGYGVVDQLYKEATKRHQEEEKKIKLKLEPLETSIQELTQTLERANSRMCSINRELDNQLKEVSESFEEQRKRVLEQPRVRLLLQELKTFEDELTKRQQKAQKEPGNRWAQEAYAEAHWNYSDMEKMIMGAIFSNKNSQEQIIKEGLEKEHERDNLQEVRELIRVRYTSQTELDRKKRELNVMEDSVNQQLLEARREFRSKHADIRQQMLEAERRLSNRIEDSMILELVANNASAGAEAGQRLELVS